MRIRIATKAVRGGAVVAPNATEIDAGVQVPWVEIDGHRIDGMCVGASVEVGRVHDDDQATIVTLRFIAGAEMVLLDREGEILP